MNTVAITLNDEHEQFIREAVESGSFTTKSELVATALDLLKMREDLRRARRGQLKAEIQKGIAELDRGETAEFELPAFLAEMRVKHAARPA